MQRESKERKNDAREFKQRCERTREAARRSVVYSRVVAQRSATAATMIAGCIEAAPHALHSVVTRPLVRTMDDGMMNCVYSPSRSLDPSVFAWLVRAHSISSGVANDDDTYRNCTEMLVTDIDVGDAAADR